MSAGDEQGGPCGVVRRRRRAARSRAAGARAFSVGTAVGGTNATGTIVGGRRSSRTASHPPGRSGPGDHGPPSRHAATLSGWPSSSAASASTRVVGQPLLAADHQRSGPARDRTRSRRPRSRGPARAGSCWRNDQSRPRGLSAERVERRRSSASTTRWRCVARHGAGALAARRRPSAPASSVTCTTTSSYRPRARPNASKPGPRLRRRGRHPDADGRGPEHRRGHSGRPQAETQLAAAACARRPGTSIGVGRAGDGPLRVLEAVPGDGAHDALPGVEPPCACTCSSPATDGGRGRLDEHALLRARAGGRPPGSARSVTASMRPPDSSRAASAGPTRPGCRSGSRWRWSAVARPARR